MLTVPVEPINANFPPDLSHMGDVAAVFDHVDVMAYGMAYTAPGWRSWHSSALTGETGHTPTSVESSVQAYLDAGVPASQLGVGIGAYGLCYSGPVTGPRQKLAGSRIIRDDYHLQYRQIRTTYQSAMKSHYDSAAEAPYLSGSKKRCTYITYENPKSIRAKLAWEAEQGLGGVIMWTVNQQYLPASGASPLLATVGKSWLDVG
jgi:chitinase